MRAERLRESHLNLTGAVILRFSFAQALDTSYFFQLLATAGVPLAGDVYKRQAEDRVAGPHKGRVGRQIGVCAAVGLHIGMLAPEQSASALAGQVLHHVNLLASAVVTVSYTHLDVYKRQPTP